MRIIFLWIKFFSVIFHKSNEIKLTQDKKLNELSYPGLIGGEGRLAHFQRKQVRVRRAPGRRGHKAQLPHHRVQLCAVQALPVVLHLQEHAAALVLHAEGAHHDNVLRIK